YVGRHQILMDLTSVKAPAVTAMPESSAEVLGLHPTLGPSVSLAGQTVVACCARPGRHTAAFLDLLRRGGAYVKESTAETHDKMMFVVQGVTHFNAIVFAKLARKLNIYVAETLTYTSPIYRIRMDMIGRILAQD